MLSKKIRTITPSFTISISAKVKALKENGADIIDLSIGEPDFYTPEKGKQAAVEAIEANKTKYDQVPGLISLREAIADKLNIENHVLYAPTEIVVSSGAKNAITNALLAVLDPEDEVIIPAPYWTSYPEMVKLCHGVPIIVQTKAGNAFKVTVDELALAVTDKTKIVLINNPSNPTGAIYTREELEPIVNFCIKNNLVILADEIYERIHFTDTFTSIPSISPDAKAHTILVNGFSKSAAMTGWRLGYTASNPEIAKAISMLQGHLISHPSTIAQWAGYGALTQGKQNMADMVATYKDRRDALVPLLKAIPKIDFIYPDGAFYLFIDLSHFTSFQFDKSTGSFSVDFCDLLLEKYGVAMVPGIAFGNDAFVRVSYATKLELVVEGLKRLAALLTELE
ncbi:MAG: aspartate aminotransferase [Clostridiales bacterium 38-18]|nr:MAG: aspartate aminotransferase [Clostridiales bacterium 38-18]